MAGVAMAGGIMAGSAMAGGIMAGSVMAEGAMVCCALVEREVSRLVARFIFKDERMLSSIFVHL